MAPLKMIYYGAAGCVGISGILHVIAPDALRSTFNLGVFFIIAGIAQIFYSLPMSRRWGRPWYYVGIIGTAIMIILWLASRIPSGRFPGGFSSLLPIGSISIVILILEFAFLLLSIRILQIQATPHSKKMSSSKEESKGGYGATSAT